MVFRQSLNGRRPASLLITEIESRVSQFNRVFYSNLVPDLSWLDFWHLMFEATRACFPSTLDSRFFLLWLYHRSGFRNTRLLCMSAEYICPNQLQTSEWIPQHKSLSHLSPQKDPSALATAAATPCPVKQNDFEIQLIKRYLWMCSGSSS